MVVTDYNEQFLDKRGTDHLIDELKAYIDGIATGDIDLSDYVTKEELQAKIDALDIDIDLSSYATKEELTTAISNIDLSAYALKSEIPTVTNGVDGKDGADGITPTIDETTKHWMIGETDTGVVAEGKDGTNGTDGIDGADGVSPTVTVSKEGSIATITCTDVNGTTTATISDGADGSSSGGSGGGDVYSTEETAIGTWIDGSTIYRKVIEYGTLATVSSANYGRVELGFEDSFGEIIRMTGLLKYSTNTHFVVDGSLFQTLLVPSTTISTYVSQVEKNKICFMATADKKIYVYYGSGYGGYSATFIIEYTKKSA